VIEGKLFEPEELRRLAQRTAFVRGVDRPTLVLGSTQPEEVVDSDAVRRQGIAVRRRRSGGGAVLVEPGRAVWVDTWVPRADPLFDDDVAAATRWVGEWWVRALEVDGLGVHTGRPVCPRWGRLICFAAVGAGEVVHEGRKVVGVAQWRSREGMLTHSLAYQAVDWDATTRMLALGSDRDAADEQLRGSTRTLGDLGHPDAEALTARLLGALPGNDTWVVERR